MNKKIMLLILIAIMATGCNQTEPIESKNEEQTELSVSDSNEIQEEEQELPEPEIIDPKDEIDLSLKPNESGRVMVLMYHNIGQEEKEWVRTPENFKKDLLTLYEKGYRPISLRDYVAGNITTPEGYTPIVLTFDDGNKNNFEYFENNSIDNNSAVGILIDFNKEYPDFSPAATFFLTGDVPFGQRGLETDKIRFLLENGMDIGNHSRTHANFTDISKEKLQEEIGSQAQYLKEFIDDESYSIDTIALPYGTRPKDDSLTSFLKEGTYNGIDYNNIAILNVGWNPGYSPYNIKFDFESIPRIRASEIKVDNVGMYNYIEYFDNNPGERFISDGLPEVITVPKEKVEFITTDSQKEVYVYDTDKKEEVDN
ncbi:MAG: polysaccharide deacetylase family protein [Gudongella sp.]|nr:polysaccharide deacetylase family protein [Gudongella sp.]